jgi:hypothetical protein
MDKEKAFQLFVKYGFKHYGGYGSDKIFEDAWYSQHWDGKDDHYRQKRDWMDDEVMSLFSWYLDQVGRDGGWNVGRLPGLMSKEEMKQFEKDVKKECEKKQHDKWAQENASKIRCDAKKMAHGKTLIDSMKVGEVYLVKFGRDMWGTRGILVEEIDKDSISGFYLDRVDHEVPMDAPEKEGYFYSRPIQYRKIKFEWEGKTFKRTRTYESKYVKFILNKVEGAIVVK